MRQKVLLSVEDNAANRRIIRDLLGKKGYKVIEAVDGEQGVALRRVPVIVVSAVDQIESVARCLEPGAEDYLRKPFNRSCCGPGSTHASRGAGTRSRLT